MDVQIVSLRAIFILLEKNGLDYPNYYKRLYALLLPQYQVKTGETVSVFHINQEEKVRFLRLLDLSLRSPKLPSKMIAAFMKRLGRVMMVHGQCHTSGDKMFVISFIANMIKRHPRCVRLIHRKRKIFKDVPTFTSDPY
jgi:U3 small nucleolar RNA-associated protein 19